MIKSIKAENYKSIKSLELELGRVNVFIGENGAGKSNILEVFALAGAAIADKLDNEFLVSRGIRVTEPEFMRTAFYELPESNEISIGVVFFNDIQYSIRLYECGYPYPEWIATATGININRRSSVADLLMEHIFAIATIDCDLSEEPKNRFINKVYEDIKSQGDGIVKFTNEEILRIIENKYDAYIYSQQIKDFLIYSPQYYALRIFQNEGQIKPLGISGEGLLKLLSVLSREEYGETLQEIKESLKALCWFEDFKLIEGDTFAPRRIAIKDRYIEDTGRYFDQMSANEGFLFLLFYFALFSTSLTPSIFAIDNIDASLNPALCEKLLRELVKLAKKHDKQVLLTTHNPAVLDGLNLHDDEQRLFVVSRNQAGETRVRRIQMKPQAPGKEKPVRLSEMFLRGSLGGIPAGF